MIDNKKSEKAVPVEQNDDVLDTVSGGLLKPIILNVDIRAVGDIGDIVDCAMSESMPQ